MGTKPASLSIFISMIFISICALMCGFIENARTAGAKWYLQMAMNSSIDSLFSQYDHQLWDLYHLFGLQIKESDAVELEFETFLKPYLETDNWYPVKLDHLEITDQEVLTDDGGLLFEKEVLEYMKYGIWDQSDINAELTDTYQEQLTEAFGVQAVSESFHTYAIDVLQLEKTLEEIGLLLKQQADKKEEALTTSKERTFLKALDQLEKASMKIPDLVDKYITEADQLSGQLDHCYEKMAAEISTLKPERLQALQQQLALYESYISEEGEKRAIIEGLLLVSEQNLSLIDEIREMHNQISDEIEEDEADWESLKIYLKDFSIPQLGFGYGIKDKEKQKWLETILQMVDFSLLSLVLPEDHQLSSSPLHINQPPSAEFNQAEVMAAGNIANQFFIHEYADLVFTDYLSEEKHTVQYEMEYLLAGKQQDDQNLEGALRQLLMIRSGFNLLYLLTDTQKREEARGVSLLITGGMPIVAEILTALILGIWAMAEAIADLRGLMRGAKVSLLKNATNWVLSMDSLLEFGKDESCGKETDDQQGFNYISYLKLALLLEPPGRKYYRMMDIIQMNLQYQRPDFLLQNCLYHVEIEAQLCGKHLFLTLPVVENHAVNIGANYTINMKTQKSY